MNPMHEGSGPARRILFLVASARRDGNSETLARQAASALDPAVEQQWLWLPELGLPPFEDIRHADSGDYPMPTGPLRFALEATLAATDIVMVAPLYWYSLPASAKLWLDHWSGWMRVAGVDFRGRMAGRTLWAITTFSDDDPGLAEPLFESLRLTARYMNMNWGGSLLGRANRPGDVLADDRALLAAKAFLMSDAAAE